MADKNELRELCEKICLGIDTQLDNAALFKILMANEKRYFQNNNNRAPLEESVLDAIRDGYVNYYKHLQKEKKVTEENIFGYYHKIVMGELYKRDDTLYFKQTNSIKTAIKNAIKELENVGIVYSNKLTIKKSKESTSKLLSSEELEVFVNEHSLRLIKESNKWNNGKPSVALIRDFILFAVVESDYSVDISDLYNLIYKYIKIDEASLEHIVGDDETAELKDFIPNPNQEKAEYILLYNEGLKAITQSITFAFSKKQREFLPVYREIVFDREGKLSEYSKEYKINYTTLDERIKKINRVIKQTVNMCFFNSVKFEDDTEYVNFVHSRIMNDIIVLLEKVIKLPL